MAGVMTGSALERLMTTHSTDTFPETLGVSQTSQSHVRVRSAISSTLSTEMNDDTWSCVLQLCSSSDLLRARVLSRQYLTLISKEIDHRRRLGNIRLTIPQFAAYTDFLDTPSRTLHLRSDGAGFGLKVLATACATQFSQMHLYVDRGVEKAYVNCLHEMGLTGIGCQMFLTKHCPLPVMHVFADAKTPSKGPEMQCLIIDAESHDNDFTGYTHVIVILRGSRSTSRLVLHIPARHSFELKPTPRWEMRAPVSPASCEQHILAMLQQYRKVLVVTDDKCTHAMKAPAGCTREVHYRLLSKDKRNRQLCVSKPQQLRLAQLQADVIIVHTTQTCWRYKDIVSLVHHTDTQRDSFLLQVFCDDASTVLWEYTRVQSFAPWQLCKWPNWLIPSPSLVTVQRVVAASISLQDPADKCVVCCRGEYFTEHRRDSLLRWWQQYHGDASVQDFHHLVSLSYHQDRL